MLINRKLLVISTLIILAIFTLACTTINEPQGWSGGAIDGDTLYIGSMEGKLLALDSETGEKRWDSPSCDFEEKEDREDCEKEKNRPIYGDPVISDGVVYVAGYNGKLYAISIDEEGKVIESERIGEKFVGGPAIENDLLVVGSSDGNLYAVNIAKDAEGDINFDEKWSFTAESSIWSTPLLDQGVAYFGTIGHKLYALSLENGKVLWKFDAGGAISSRPLVERGRVYFGSFDGVFYAVEASTGVESWRFDEARNWYWASPLVYGDTVYAASLDGNLYALNLETGRHIWTYETEGSIVGTPAIIEDMIAIPSSDGRVVIVKPKNGEMFGKCNIGEAIWTSIVEHEGILYFGVKDHSIRSLTVKKNGNPDEYWIPHFTNRDEPQTTKKQWDPVC